MKYNCINFESICSQNASEEDNKDISIKSSIKHNEFFQPSATKCNDDLKCTSFSTVIESGKQLPSMKLLLLPTNEV